MWMIEYHATLSPSPHPAGTDKNYIFFYFSIFYLTIVFFKYVRNTYGTFFGRYGSPPDFRGRRSLVRIRHLTQWSWCSAWSLCNNVDKLRVERETYPWGKNNNINFDLFLYAFYTIVFFKQVIISTYNNTADTILHEYFCDSSTCRICFTMSQYKYLLLYSQTKGVKRKYILCISGLVA